MEAALITSIVAVVLGGIGLIGGVIGYVQGTAALHRATAARQRATQAEEAALQARAAAEAAMRSAEELLERLQRNGGGDPRTGPVPTGPVASGTGPVGVAPSPFPPTSTGPTPTSPFGGSARPQPPVGPVMPGATSGADLLTGAPAPAERQPAAAFAFPLGRVRPSGDAAQEETPAPDHSAAPAAPVSSTPVVIGEPATGPLRTASGADAVRLDGPVLGAESGAAGRPAERQPAEAFAFPLSTRPPVAVVQQGQIVQAQPPASDPQGGPSVSSEVPDTTVPEPGAAAAAPGEDVAVPEQDSAGPQADVVDPDPDATAPERGSRGQVVVGTRDAPPMDWAEVLRTGAIPLPSIARGTYAAPRRGPKPTGQGPARFELRVSGRQRYEAVNVGGEEARDARVEGAGDDPHLVRPLSSRSATVPAGGALAFSVLRVEGREAAAQVLWIRDGETVTQPLPL